ncbi:MAG: hypothetical protein OER77_07525 [Myxococcales bacterium]|nr:hypothetical protein [Myxococcales bacterium]
MRYIVLIVGVALMFDANAMAQEEAAVGTVTSPEATVDPAPSEAEPTDPPPKEEKKRSPYYKKVQGWLWIEGFAGPTAYDPDQFGGLSVSGVPNAPRLSGPEYGLSVLLGLGGFVIGATYRQANYSQYKLMKFGVDMQGIFRFVPYVHPMVRAVIAYARTFDGNPYGLDNAESDGVVFTGGFGLRIPIIRWMSFAATFDWSFVGLSLRGDNPTDGSRFKSWIGGQQFGATFALTFHFIGVRKN